MSGRYASYWNAFLSLLHSVFRCFDINPDREVNKLCKIIQFGRLVSHLDYL